MKFQKMFLNGLWILVLLFAFGGTPALAEDCAVELGKIVIEMDTIELTQDEIIHILSLKKEAARLCSEGKSAEALVLINEAKALLGIQ